MSIKAEEKTSFNILIVSDIHDRIDNVKKLITEQKSKNEKIDIILDCGDTIDLPIGKNYDKEVCDIYFKKLQEIHAELSALNAPIFWVPGNHEPANLFEENSPEINPLTTNLHKKFKKLANNLYIAGLGGSVPILNGGKWNKDYIFFKTLDKKNLYCPGFPYYDKEKGDFESGDAIFGKDLEELIKKTKEEGGEDVSIILLSHVGPLYSATNSIVEGGKVLYLGSEVLGQILEREKGIFVNIHGHSHTAEGIIRLNDNKYVINPGANLAGHYAKLMIKKDQEGKWKSGEATIGYL